MLADIEAGFEKLARNPKALAAYRAESQEIERGFPVPTAGYSGCLDTGGDLRAQVDRLRDEWR
ncbi:MAG: hypothetical protein WD404_05110 [Solirubrobacterales bacterium]